MDVVKKTIETPEIQQRNVEQIVDTPVLPIVEELAEASKVFSQDRAQQRFEEQTIEPPAISLAVKVVEVPDIQMQGRDSPTARSTVAQIEGRQSKNAQRESILTQSDMPVVVQRQVSMVQKAMEAPQMQVVLKTVEDPQLQIVEKTADGRTETPEIQTVRGTQTSKSLGLVPEHQLVQAETVKVDKIGAPLSTESASPISVTASVLENPPVVVGSVQPVPTAEYVEHAHALTDAHGAPVVECATSTHTVACAAPVTTMTAAPTVFPTTTVPVFMQKTAATPPVQFIDRVVNVPVTAHRQTPVIQKVQKTVEVPQIQFIDKFADAPASVQTEGQKRKLPLPTEGKTLFVNTASGDEEEDEGETHAPVHFSLCDSDELETRSKGEHEGTTVRQVDDILLEMKDVKSELQYVRELIGVLVRKGVLRQGQRLRPVD